jgi:hypothetical protein
MVAVVVWDVRSFCKKNQGGRERLGSRVALDGREMRKEEEND